MSFIPKPYEIYKHFKGNLYQILALAEHSETGEQLVIYQALYGSFRIYARPLSMFTEKVDKSKYPEAAQEFRFVLQTAALQAATPQEETEADSEPALDPLVVEFMDADSYEQRLNILTALHHRITDDMITTMAIVSDVEINEGTLEERYTSLRNCLLTRDRFECNRLR